MKAAVVGGGVLGLTMALRLAQRGHSVTLYEAAPQLGGLACSQDYGAFTWDRFYHCILPQDDHLIGLLGELGLAAELRWRRTGTGYFAAGQMYDMSSNRDFLRFPLLRWRDKARLAALTLHAGRLRNPLSLYQVTARQWLTRICGRRAYEQFWRPLLKAKFGTFHDQVAAVFIWATVQRLFGARRGAANKEHLGYVRGGYQRILDHFVQQLGRLDARVRAGCAVQSIELSGARCRLQPAQGEAELFDQVLFTAPTRLAREVADARLQAHAAAVEARYPTGQTYLGVACLVLTLRRPLTPYYVLNIGEEGTELTGLVEMTSLVDAEAETAGRALVYLPRYMSSDDPLFDAPDEAIVEPMLTRGLQRLFPDFSRDDAEYLGVHRARFVQPLPLVRQAPPTGDPLPRLERPFQIFNTSMLSCATLNNNEVVGLVDRFVERSRF